MSKNVITNKSKSVLISGASVAGLTAAYWLNHYGFEVTVVERSKYIRKGGYPIDIQGEAIDVIKRMGIHSNLQKEHINTNRISFINQDGSKIGAFHPELISNNNKHDLEMSRGKLVDILFQNTQNKPISYLFNESISDINTFDSKVEVVFLNDERRNFDFVIGADGIHSNTRRIIFGEEDKFLYDLEYRFNGFSIPNEFGYYKEAVIYAKPGKAAMLYASGNSDILHVLLAHTSKLHKYIAHDDMIKQHELLSTVFSDDGWKIPNLLTSMHNSKDLYHDIIGQIHMERWFKDRIVLVGDASSAPSFLSGQGSSLAILGSYILAEEMASHKSYKEAFEEYERRMRPIVKESQDKAINSAFFLIPKTNEEIEMRNQILSNL